MRAALFVVAVISAVAGAVPSRAEQPVRTGFALGFGLGGGSVSWEWPDGDRRREESGAGNVRVGWASNQEVLIGIEGWAWSKDYEFGSTPEDVPARVRIWSAALAATYFPGNVGFFVRGGVGVGGASIEVTPPPSVSFPVSGTTDDTGLSALIATGYEAGVTPRFALGGAIHAVYVGVDAEPLDDVLGYGLTVQLNWYW